MEYKFAKNLMEQFSLISWKHSYLKKKLDAQLEKFSTKEKNWKRPKSALLVGLHIWEQDKTVNFKWDKTADYLNQTELPIL